MIKKIRKRVISTILLILTVLTNLLSNFPMVQSLAVNNNSIGTTLDIISVGKIPYHLKSHRVGNKGYVLTHLVGYYDNGTFYPAFCMNKDRLGADEELSYNVTITEFLENTEMYNKVWRVVTNGYPYKSAEDLGVSDWVYAYQATKMAVYCVTGQTNVEDFYATDSIGQEIVDLIHRLVDIGNNGSATYKTPVSNINKAGNIFLNGSYYIQNYSLNANIDITSYEITITGFPDGTKVTDVNGVERKTFNAGETFQVRLPKDSLETEDINGRIRATVTSKSYPMFYATAYNEVLQDYTITGDPLALTSSTSDLNLKGNTGKIKINKKDDETNELISGVKFQLLKKDDSVVGTATTDNNGVASFSGLYQGNYILKEIETNKNYILNNKELEVNVKYDETTIIDITNEHKKGQIKIIKVDLDNNQVKLQGVEFKVYDENKNVVETLVTDKNGEAISEKLRANKRYTVQETKTLQNYVLNNNPKTIELNSDQIATLKFENELKKGQIRIIKVDKDFNEIKLKGVEFKIYNENNELVDTLVTNENGEAISKRLRIDKKYTIEETKTLKNYVLNQNPQTVILQQDQITDVEFENEYKKGNLKIYKVDKDNHKIGLGNVAFDLYSDEFKKVIGSYTTNVDGEIIIDNLRIGNYKLIEKSTGKWYNLADDKELKIEWNKTTESMLENELQKGQIKVIKIDKDNHEVKLKGVKFEVLDEKGNVLETITSNENGEAYTSRYAIRDYGKLSIREKETLNEYALTEKIKTIELQKNKITSITFENEKIKGYIEIKKISKDDNKLTNLAKSTPLENATFEIYTETDELADTITTNKDGKAKSKLLEYGNYYVKEKNSGSDYYLLNTEKYEIQIKEHNKTIPVTIENKSVEVGLDIDKKGIIQAQPNDEIKYSFNTLKNTSNVCLDNFTWIDNLPTDYIRITKLFTGTFNQDLDYIVKYKTNKSEDYIEYGKYNTQKNNYINFTKVELEYDEFITDYKVEFGTVDPGFQAVEKPFIFCRVLGTVKADDKWVNYTSLTGNYKEHKLEDKAGWSITSYFKKLEIDKLPTTGF